MKTCPLGTGCWVSCFFMCVAWWLVSSVLLFLTWNKVLATMTKVKPAKYWQALLVVATVCVFAAPCYVAKHHCGKSPCHEGKKGDCPYSQDDGEDSSAKKK